MPCYIDTIVKINQIRQTYRDESKLTLYAIGAYPIKSKDCELELVLFVPINKEEKDPNTQSIFEKNEFYCISRKIIFANFNSNLKLKMTIISSIHLTITRDLGSNRCSLKALLVGIMQDKLTKIDNENAIINVQVDDYAGQNYNFIIKIVFSHHNARFKHLINPTQTIESMLFIVGQNEVIEKDLYIYATDISYININFE
ncbi:hypothetical protein F8M41_008328 [Gigaspora margarita]|uniref:Uncharacterized protein n=1 Tax=Gigaspora margarita TaxID=4874 RepID=A0A8H4AVV6_GIGMA|nr:hypothetical protein F8M41_008328 [Gigaspora margarita]